MKTLEDFRKEIDKLDDELLNVLSKRTEIVREIGKIKKEKGIPLFDKKRWQEIIKSKISKAKILNLPEKFIQRIFSIIHEHSLEIEKEEK